MLQGSNARSTSQPSVVSSMAAGASCRQVSRPQRSLLQLDFRKDPGWLCACLPHTAASGSGCALELYVMAANEQGRGSVGLLASALAVYLGDVSANTPAELCAFAAEHNEGSVTTPHLKRGPCVALGLLTAAVPDVFFGLEG